MSKRYVSRARYDVPLTLRVIWITTAVLGIAFFAAIGWLLYRILVHFGVL